MPNMTSRTALLVPILLFLSSATAADQGKSFSVSGFGTLGLVHNTSDQVDIVRDLSQSEGVGYTRQTDFGVDSLLGLQINTSLSESTDAAVQVISRRAANGFDPELSWAYGRYVPNNLLQLRAGRLGFDAFMLADSRNIGYSYPWVRPPIDFFGSLIVSYFDGADALLSQPLASGLLRAKFFAGVAREKISTDSHDHFFSLNGSTLGGAHLEYQTPHWLYRVGYAELRFKN